MLKKFLVIGLVIGMCSWAFAGIKQSNVERRLINIVKNVKTTALSCNVNMGNSINDAIDIIQQWGSSIDTDDKTKLQTLKVKIQDAQTELDEVVSYITINFDSIE